MRPEEAAPTALSAGPEAAPWPRGWVALSAFGSMAGGEQVQPPVSSRAAHSCQVEKVCLQGPEFPQVSSLLTCSPSVGHLLASSRASPVPTPRIRPLSLAVEVMATVTLIMQIPRGRIIQLQIDFLGHTHHISRPQQPCVAPNSLPEVRMQGTFRHRLCSAEDAG